MILPHWELKEVYRMHPIIKSMKILMDKNLTNWMLTYEEFCTILIQDEGYLNWRPYILRDTPEAALIRSHFLTGSSLFYNPEAERRKGSIGQKWWYITMEERYVMMNFNSLLAKN